MNASARKLIERLWDDSPTERNDSARALGLWLEMRTLGKVDIAASDQLLPPDLIENPPTPADERDVLLALGTVVKSPEGTSTSVWALSKASSIEALEYILAVLRAPADEESVWQALIGVDNWLQRPRAELDPNVAKLVNKYDALSVLRTLGENGSERVRALAAKVLHRVGTRS